MTDQHVHRDVLSLPIETWDDASRGGVSWRTLFSGHLTGTEGLSTGVCEVPVGEALHPHHHATVESYFILAGDAVLTLGTTEHALGPGSSALIPADTTHGLRNTGTGPVRFFYVFATDSFTDVEHVFDPPTDA